MKAQGQELLPWVAVTSFTSNKQNEMLHQISSIEQLEAQLLTLTTTCNYPHVLHIKGKFNNLTIGSVPKQSIPYAPIEQIIKESFQIDTGPIVAECVGFYAPEFMFPIKSKGLHLHCISEDKAFGGHVLALDLKSAELNFEVISQFQIELPQNECYQKAQLDCFKSEKHASTFTDKLTLVDA